MENEYSIEVEFRSIEIKSNEHVALIGHLNNELISLFFEVLKEKNLLIFLLPLMLLVACSEPESDNSAFAEIQSRILTPSCAIKSCHSSSSDPFFNQHKLILTAGQSFNQLVDRAAFNQMAATEGMKLVTPGDPEKSFLFHKLQRASSHHNGMAYGNPMPLGLDKISVGQLEFIRQWIEAGAPQKGATGDVALLEDMTPQPDYFEPLSPPASGYQVRIEPFQVPANYEREFFTYRSVGNNVDVYVNRIEIKMRENSHHLVIYDYKNGTPATLIPKSDALRDIRNADGSYNIENLGVLGYHVFINGAQTSYHEFRLPAGVVMKISAGMKYDFNPHYVNKGSSVLYGEAQINFHTVAFTPSMKLAQSINWANQNIDLPPGQRTTLTKTFTAQKKMYVFSLTSHTHQLGEKFRIQIFGGQRNGEIVYENNDWHHPEIQYYDPPIVLNPGEGLTSVVTYNNTTTKSVSFGLLSTNEMGIIFGAYYEDL